MALWAALLRALGTVLVLLTINETIMIASQFDIVSSWLAFSNFLRPQIERLAMVALCFGGASGLLTLRRADERLAPAGAARRQTHQVQAAVGYTPDIPPPPPYPQHGLAPVAPDWDELPPPPPYGGGAGQRLERRYRDGAAGIADAFDERMSYVAAHAGAAARCTGRSDARSYHSRHGNSVCSAAQPWCA